MTVAPEGLDCPAPLAAPVHVILHVIVIQLYSRNNNIVPDMTKNGRHQKQVKWCEFIKFNKVV